MDIRVSGFTLNSLSEKNVILGKNGCGKSYLMTHVEQAIRGQNQYGEVRYISPERGGILEYNASIDQSLSNDNWLANDRRKNQSGSFRQQSATLFRRLEILVLREIEKNQSSEAKPPIYFDETIAQINLLLERVTLERDNKEGFKILERGNRNPVAPNTLSSGESELISLGIEILTFVKESKPDKSNVLLIDEPDVHLHPDLQDRLAKFMVKVLEGKSVTLILATHSTALLAGLASDPETRVAFKLRGNTTLEFKPVTDIERKILPIFGAHPLSNVFNESPILLVEGEDDERICVSFPSR